MTPEGKIKKEICDYLALYPYRCLYTVHLQNWGRFSSRHMKYGWPDISGIWDKKPLFIEVKTPQGKLSPEQEQVLAKARILGAIVILARSLDDVSKTLY